MCQIWWNSVSNFTVTVTKKLLAYFCEHGLLQECSKHKAARKTSIFIHPKIITYKIHKEREFCQARCSFSQTISGGLGVEWSVVEMYTFICCYQFILLLIIASVIGTKQCTVWRFVEQCVQNVIRTISYFKHEAINRLSNTKVPTIAHNWHGSIRYLWFILIFHTNHGPILYHFQDVARQRPKTVNVYEPMPLLRDSPLNCVIAIGLKTNYNDGAT